MSTPPAATLDAFRAAFRLGAELFDRGAFFEAHEAWETHWRASHDANQRLFLQGLIQVTAGFHKLFVMRAPEPAQRLWTRGLEKLDRAHVELSDFDLPAFRAAVRTCSEALATGTLERSRVPKLVNR